MWKWTYQIDQYTITIQPFCVKQISGAYILWGIVHTVHVWLPTRINEKITHYSFQREKIIRFFTYTGSSFISIIENILTIEHIFALTSIKYTWFNVLSNFNKNTAGHSLCFCCWILCIIFGKLKIPFLFNSGVEGS